MAQPFGRPTSEALHCATLTPGVRHSRKRKATLRTVRAAAIMLMPTKSSSRRPYWSTRQTVKSVARSFTKPTPVEESAAEEPKPADLKMLVAKYSTEGWPVTCCRKTRPQPMHRGRGYLKASVHFAAWVPTVSAMSARMAWSSPATSAGEAAARKKTRAAEARCMSSSSPPRRPPSRMALSTRNLGDWGMKAMPTSMTSAKAAETRTMKRQPMVFVDEKTKPMKKPRKMPRTTTASLAETSVPRTSAGEISAMYTGAACMAKPMPRP
mmetsp:Transcript_68712/g.213329  ORF Transcript_68712/g.213329 Transcript_68712/m.213329 type:complete len:267 (+) Transcript_68712:591-1391(+)